MKLSAPAPIPVDDVGACLQRLFLDDERTARRPGSPPSGPGGLRKEDLQKAKELAPLLHEIARITTKKQGVFVDACAGKSALGFVAAALVLPAGWRIVVVERDPVRVAHARLTALKLDRDVTIVEGDIAATALPVRADVVAALHACGPASDAVVDAAAAAQARHLLLVPCCYGAHPHKGPGLIPGQQAAAAFVDVLPRQGLVGRRFAQAVIDAERTLRLEAAGYDVDVVEFCAPTVTPHNLLWRARKSDEPVRMSEAARKLTRLRAGVARA